MRDRPRGTTHWEASTSAVIHGPACRIDRWYIGSNGVPLGNCIDGIRPSLSPTVRYSLYPPIEDRHLSVAVIQISRRRLLTEYRSNHTFRAGSYRLGGDARGLDRLVCETGAMPQNSAK